MLTRARDQVGWPVLVVLGLLGLAPVVFTGVTTQSVLVVAMIYAVGAVGLDVLTGYSGQYSFGQFVYFAVGAYVMSSLRVHAHAPWFAALVAGVVAAGVLAAVVGAALVRLKFFGSAVGTFFLGAVVVDILDGNRLAHWTGGSSGIAAPPVSIGGIGLASGFGLYYSVLIALALSCAVALRFTRVRVGRACRVVKENETVAAVMGVRVVREKLRAQILAGALAGLGGCLLAINLGYLSPGTFSVTQSIELFAIVAVGGIGSIAGPIVGAVFFFTAINELSSASASASGLIFALVLLVVVVLFNGGLYDLGERLVRLSTRVRNRFAKFGAEPGPSSAPGPVSVSASVEAVPLGCSPSREAVADVASHVTAVRPRSTVPTGSSANELLRVDGLTVRYGGVMALDGVSLDVASGEVHAIIGPNGAGKTTLLNCISGIQPVAAGAIEVEGRSLAGLSVSSRRASGIARTFQHPSLVADLDVVDNVTVGAYDSHDGSIWTELVGTSPKRRRCAEARTRAVQTLEVLKFPRERWSVLAGDMTMGEQKHVDIARAMAAHPKLLLLDEPTAGLGVEEVDAVAKAIRVVQQAGVTVLVIAHHVGFIRLVADRCTVLDFGKVLAAGTPESTLEDPRVADVFLGTGGGGAEAGQSGSRPAIAPGPEPLAGEPSAIDGEPLELGNDA